MFILIHLVKNVMDQGLTRKSKLLAVNVFVLSVMELDGIQRGTSLVLSIKKRRRARIKARIRTKK